MSAAIINQCMYLGWLAWRNRLASMRGGIAGISVTMAYQYQLAGGISCMAAS